MRPIHSARLDKTRPVLVLTRELVRPYLRRVTIAPITSTVRGLSTEVISCDNIVTVPATALGRQIGYLLPAQESELTTAVLAAFDLG